MASGLENNGGLARQPLAQIAMSAFQVSFIPHDLEEYLQQRSVGDLFYATSFIVRFGNSSISHLHMQSVHLGYLFSRPSPWVSSMPKA